MQWGKHTRTCSHRLLLHRVMNCSFVLSFLGQSCCLSRSFLDDKALLGRRKVSRTQVLFVLSIVGYMQGYGGGVGVQHTSERNPTWVEWEQMSPRKHWTSKTKHFLWKWIYLLAWLPEEPRQNGFLMGNRATVWGLPKDLHEKQPIWGWAKTVKSFRGAELTPKYRSEYK